MSRLDVAVTSKPGFAEGMALQGACLRALSNLTAWNDGRVVSGAAPVNRPAARRRSTIELTIGRRRLSAVLVCDEMLCARRVAVDGHVHVPSRWSPSSRSTCWPCAAPSGVVQRHRTRRVVAGLVGRIERRVVVGTVAADGQVEHRLDFRRWRPASFSLVTRRRSVMVLVLKVPLAPGGYLQALSLAVHDVAVSCSGGTRRHGCKPWSRRRSE